jgi:RNA polymerase sigma-70 factor (ECF subfamily)
MTPRERAVFVLREAFGYSHREVGDILGITEANSRQVHARARQRLDRADTRYPVDAVEHERLVRRFLAATVRGDLAELTRLLADSVHSVADGGGEVTAARRPIVGRERVVRYLGAMSSHPGAAGLEVSVAEVNGQPAGLFHAPGAGLGAVLLPAVSAGVIVVLRLVVNPAKLRFLAGQRHEPWAYPVKEA